MPQILQPKSVEDAESIIRDEVAGDETVQDIFAAAVAGRRIVEARNIIGRKLKEKNVAVPGFSIQRLTDEIFVRNWGLGAVDATYHDSDVDEIQLNGNKVFAVRRGVPERLPFTLKEGEAERLARRMIMHDSGVSLSETSPTAETVRLDGTRVTAVCPNVSPNWSVALRKHGNVDLSVENLEKMGTLDRMVWAAECLLVRGRCNILISGNFGAGKTSHLSMLFGQTHPSLRAVVLESRRELRLSELYPDRNIVELEEHPEVGLTMKKLFDTVVVRLSPGIIIVGEFRGTGESREAIKAATKGHKGSMATTHAVSPQEAVFTTAMMMLEEGLNLPLDLAVLRVAQAYDIIIQMFYDSVTGVRKLESMTEIVKNGDKVDFRELIRWTPDSAYHGSGKWTFVRPPTDHLIENMFRFGVGKEEVESLWN